MKIKKPSFKTYYIDDPIYYAKLTLYIGDTKEIRNHLLKVTNIPRENLNVEMGKFIPFEKLKIIILPKYDLLTLIHEVIHYAFNIMDSRGIPINYENDETITYYTEMTLKNIIKALNKKI
jgi:hypothetical protein